MHHALTVDQLMEKGRRRELTMPRHQAMWEVRENTLLSFPSIGKVFKMHHTSILHGVNAHQGRVDAGSAEPMPLEHLNTRTQWQRALAAMRAAETHAEAGRAFFAHREQVLLALMRFAEN